MTDHASLKPSSDPTALPSWLVTFVDLLVILLCLFICLFSYSEIDGQKYQRIASSLQNAFAGQARLPRHDMRRETASVIKNLSSPKQEPIAVNTVKRRIAESDNQLAVINSANMPFKRINSGVDKNTEKDLRRVAIILHDEIKSGKIEVEALGSRIIIRMLEKASFPTGSATLNDDFKPVMSKISEAIQTIPGKIKIAGHTDDIPIATNRFRSNWYLSAARALSVVHDLLADDSQLNPQRFEIIGYGDTQPRVPNSDDDNRAKNRRVEIIIEQAHTGNVAYASRAASDIAAQLPPMITKEP